MSVKRKSKPCDPSKRRLYFKVPEDPKELDAFVNSVVDEMERVDREDAAAERAAKKAKAKAAK